MSCSAFGESRRSGRYAAPHGDWVQSGRWGADRCVAAKAVLTKSRYYDALGSVVEAAPSRILGDVLALEDITETESHRLSELCRILSAL